MSEHVTQFDENLIIRMADGDGNAFQKIYQHTSSAVYGFALSILKNKHDAEDVMHDTFLKAYSGAITYKPMGKPLAWILTITRNLCYNKIRAGKVCEEVSEYDSFTAGDNSDITADMIVLEAAMKTLAFEERQIVILHALTGLKHREIADILEVPTGTVLSKYNRAIKKLRSDIEGRGEMI